MSIALLFLLVLILLLLGVPVAISLGFSSLLYILFVSRESLTILSLNFFNATEHYTLLAIPFFILASAFMSSGGVAERIVRFAIAAVGWARGGLAMAGVFACMIFAALSGSSPATVIAIGTIVIGGMVKAGYTKDFAAGVIANAGTLGILIPPSIVMVVYAAAVDVSVGRMFIAGIIPGILAGLSLMVGIYVAARITNLPAQPFRGLNELLFSFLHAAFGLFLIVIIIGGIYGGLFTPTEAAAVASVYAFLIANLIYRDIGPITKQPWAVNGESPAALVWRNSWLTVKGFMLSFVHRDNLHVLVDSARTTIMLMFIIANALLFAHVLTAERIPQAITEAMIGLGLNKWTFLLAVNILLLLGGQFMEPSGLLLIVAPVVYPLAIELGVDPIHLGIIMVVNMEIGMITPPIGLNLFVTSGITGMSLPRVIKAASPWVLILLAFLVLVTYVPQISTWLYINLMGPEIVTRL